MKIMCFEAGLMCVLRKEKKIVYKNDLKNEIITKCYVENQFFIENKQLISFKQLSYF